jgi:hypothetical protein
MASTLMMPVCTGWLTERRLMMPGNSFDGLAASCGIWAFAIDRTAEGVDHAAKKSFAYGHREKLTGGS